MRRSIRAAEKMCAEIVVLLAPRPLRSHGRAGAIEGGSAGHHAPRHAQVSGGVVPGTRALKETPLIPTRHQGEWLLRTIAREAIGAIIRQLTKRL